MSNQELAEWAGKSKSYIEKRKKYWCENQLSKYANYKMAYGGVEIIEIIEPVFQGPGLKEVRKNFINYWGNGKEKIDSNKNCWYKMEDNMVNQLSETTGIEYVGMVKREKYGVPGKRTGTDGQSYWVFCKIIQGEAYSFSEEEEKIKKSLEDIYLKDQKKNVYKLKALRQALKEQEITQEEYSQMLEDIIEYEMGWAEFVEALQKKLGCQVGFRQRLEDGSWKVPEGSFVF